MNDRKLGFLLNIAYYAVLLFILIYLFKFIIIYLFPVIIGLLVTVMVQRPANAVSSFLKIKKGTCALFLVIISYTALIALIVFVVFKAWGAISDLINNYSYLFSDIGNIIGNISNKLNELNNKIPDTVSDSITSTLNNVISSISSYISTVAKNTAKVMPMFFTGSIVTVIASCYIAKDYDRFKASVISVMSNRYKKAAAEFKFLLKDNILKMLKGYLKLLLITFLELTIGLLLLGVKEAVVISAIIAIVDLLPILGTGAVLIPWGVYQLVLGNYFFGAGLLILYLIIILVKNIIEPKIIGKQIGLHPLISLIAVFIGFKLFGFIGIFTLPLAVMLIWKMYERGIFSLVFENSK